MSAPKTIIRSETNIETTYRWLNYVQIARIDHWFKNIFMLPGFGLAVLFSEKSLFESLWPFLLAVLSTCFAASANYVINEWLDAEFDRFHPTKKNRPSALGNVEKKYVYLEYVFLVILALSLASLLGTQFSLAILLLIIMGVLYNVAPFRTKDRVYVDVLSESVNNPLRLLLGWLAVASNTLPPVSIVLSYWMGGAFLMAIKRYAEYRHIGDPERAGLYRRSFRYYSEDTLLVSSFFYALSSSFFLAIFLIKYRIEFLFSFPLFALLFSWYLALGLKENSPAQSPEKLYKETNFVLFLCVLALSIGIMFVVDIPWLSLFIEPVIIELP